MTYPFHLQLRKPNMNILSQSKLLGLDPLQHPLKN